MITMNISDFLQVVANDPKSHWYDVSNWDITKSIEDIVDAINKFNSNTKSFFETVSNIVYYFTHPKVLAWMVWCGLVKYSFWICLFICLFSVIAYIIGWKKGKTWAKGSIAAYIVIMMFNSALS